MKTKRNLLRLWVILLVLTSCTVTNNLYVNDPVPAGKSNLDLYLGLGTGFTPQIDSTSLNRDIHYSDDLSIAPNLCIGGRYGLGEQTDLRFALHLPYIISGIGLHAGIQYSFFKEWTKFNLALGTDLGGVFAKDSLNLSDDSGIALDPATKGAINADLFLPVSYNFSNNYRIILTPRISFNSIYIKKNEHESKSQKYQPICPALSLGARLNKIYPEATVLYCNNTIIPAFGISFMFSGDINTD